MNEIVKPATYRTVLVLAAAWAAIILLLHLAAAQIFSPLAWGINSFAFLPPWGLYLYLGGGMVVIGLTLRGLLARPLDAAASAMDRFPSAVLVLSIAAMAGTAAALRVTLPLLGDSFITVNNFEYSFTGVHALNPWRAPLALWYFYGIMSLLGTTAYPRLMDGFLWGEIVLLAAAVTILFFFSRIVAAEPRKRLLLFLSLLVLPSFQVFFGYAETYAVSVVLLAGLALAGAGHTERGWWFGWLPPLMTLALFAHYLNALLLPAVVYLAVREWRTSGIKAVAAGTAISLVIPAALFAAFGADIGRYISGSTHSPLLTLTGTGDEFQAYPILSWMHISEIGNLVLLLSPFGALLLALVLRSGPRLVVDRPLHRFLLLACAGYGAFLLAAKFDLGMATDWDVSAPYFVLINLSLVLLYLRSRLYAEPVLLIVILLTAASALPWFALNASVEPNIARKLSLQDPRILPASGYYQSMFHLSTAHIKRNQARLVPPLWLKYIGDRPADFRGYQKLAEAYWEIDRNDPRVAAAFDSSLRRQPENRGVRISYSRYCVEAGSEAFRRGDGNSAGMWFRRALALDSANATAQNNMGYWLASRGEAAQAVPHYAAAIALKPDYKLPYSNLGLIRLGEGRFAEAESLLLKAVSIDPQYVQAYDNLAKLYYTVRDREKTVWALQKAARLGSKDARRTLQEGGERW